MTDFQIPAGATRLVVNTNITTLLIEWKHGANVLEKRRINPAIERYNPVKSHENFNYIKWLLALVKSFEYAEPPTDTRRVWKVANNG